MAESDQRESAVLEAVRSFLNAGSSVHKVAEAMAQIEAQTSKVPLRNLDWWEREIRRELWSSERHALPKSWSAFFRSKDVPTWLDLCSGDGRRRERALRSIATPAPNAFFFALALRRLNDWVPQVRAAAQARIGPLAQSSAPNCVAEALCHELTHWGSWGRIGVADREAVVRLTELPAVAQAVKSRILSGVAGPLAKLLSEVGRAPSLDPWLLEIASEAVQPSVRAKAYQCMIEGRMTWVVGQKWVWTQIQWCKGRWEPVLAYRELGNRWPLVPLLRAAAVDRSPIVRNVAAQFLIKHLDEIRREASDLARSLSNDVSPYVAERGRFALGRLAASE